MSYIGRGLQSGAFRQLDDISSGFDGSDTTHTMQVNSTNVTVGDVNQILLSLGGVIQKPGTDFTVSSSTLTFTTAPAANTSFFAILLGSDNGGTVTPTDESVTTSKLANTISAINNTGGNLVVDVANEIHLDSDDGVIRFKDGGTQIASFANSSSDFVIASAVQDKDIKFQGDDGGSSITAMTIDMSAGGRVGIGTTSPDDALHVKGNLFLEDSSPEITLETTNSSHYNWQIAAQENVANSFEIAVGSADADASNDSFTSTLLINSIGAVTMPLQPAFLVSPSDAAAQNNISSTTVITFGDEIFDQNADFSGYTFTAPVTGKYQLNASLRLGGLDADANYHFFQIETSNRNYQWIIDPRAFDADAVYWPAAWSALADMDANDTAYIKFYQDGGANQLDIETGGSFFSGFLAC